PVDGLLEAVALDETHGVERPAVGITAQAVNRHDAGVLQAAGDLPLADETAAAFGIVGVAFLNLFERHLAVQLAVLGHEDFTQAAPVMETEGTKPGHRGDRAYWRRGRGARGLRRYRLQGGEKTLDELRILTEARRVLLGRGVLVVGTAVLHVDRQEPAKEEGTHRFGNIA